jgi:hypothetical protein
MSRTSVDKQYLEKRIADVYYKVMPDGRTTICTIAMVNGFTVNGFSACVLASNFDAALGRRYSYENAFEQLWPLEGYLLAEELHGEARGNVNHDIGWAIRQAKNGMRVALAGWNASGQWVSFSPGQDSVDYSRFWSEANKQFAKEQPTGCVPVSAGMTLKNVQGMIVMGWVPSTTDLLMQDWEIVL